MKRNLFLMGLIYLFTPAASFADQLLQVSKVAQAPVVDGSSQDSAWAQAKAIVTHDRLAEIDITLKSVFTLDEIFFLIRFPDAEENRMHKLLQWDKAMEIYKPGPTREDTIVIKWSMEPYPIDLISI